MKKRFVTAFLCLTALGSFNAFSQTTSPDPVIFEVGGQKIYKSEFMNDFMKSISKDPVALPSASAEAKRQALDEYVQLYVTFRAKLMDAYAMQLDTATSMKNELKQYRDELAAPYLIDSTVMEQILREAYERNKYAIHAAHILVKVTPNASAEDTLKAYNEAMAYYKRAASGEDFYQIAQEQKRQQLRENPGIRNRSVSPTEGDLGCFTAFDMVYPFENAAYSLNPGEVSLPVRSRYGYHIIKVFKKFPYFGNTELQHIWLRDDVDPRRAESLINSLYDKLQNGESFESLAKNNSDDRQTSGQGGLLPDLRLSQMPPEYVEQIANGLKEGEYSKPFHTHYGWHIIKVKRLEKIPAYEDMVPYYKQRLARDQRSNEPKSIYVERCKQKYNFTDYTKTDVPVKGKASKRKPVAKMASLDEMKSMVTDSVFFARWTYNPKDIKDTRPLFQLEGKTYTTADLAHYIFVSQQKERRADIAIFVERKYEEFVNSVVEQYADSRLEIENPEFKAIVDEYKNGLMIFSYNDRMIWSKAIQDTAGFNAFYERAKTTHDINNPEESVYFWKSRARVNVITIADSQMIDPEKAVKVIDKVTKKNYDSATLRAALTKKINKKFRNDELPKMLTMSPELEEEGNQDLLAASEWAVGVYVKPMPEKGYRLLFVEQILEPGLKSAREARGYYMNDYQDELEENLRKELFQKYNVIIHDNVVDEITY